MASFLENLRMNNIFPPEGMGLPHPLIGMPDFNSGRQIQQQQQPGIQQIGQRMASPTSPIVPRMNPDMPTNFEYKPPESDKYGTQILMGTTERDKQQRAKELLGVKSSTAQAGQQGSLAIKQQLANIAKYKAEHPGLKAITTKGGDVQLMNPATGEMIDTGVDTGTLSEQDKLDLMGENAQNLEGTKQTGRMELQGAKQTGALEQIGARAAGNKDVANIRMGSPTQQIAGTRNAILQIQNTRPDLAKYLVKDPTTGQVNIDPNTPLNELSMIQNIINPKSQPKDIELPSNGKGGTPQSTTPKSKTPTAADLIKKYGG